MEQCTNPFVSIIMPAFNPGIMIKESIQSVLNQSFKNWELIVINDGSSDNTSEWVKRFCDSRIKLIEKDNTGVADSRNLGIKEAKGEYIAFLDSDDIWLPEKIELQLECFRDEETVGLVHTGYCEFDELGEYKPKPLKHVDLTSLSGNVYHNLVIHDFVATLTVMAKKEVFENVGFFDTNLNGPEDWDLWIRIAWKYKFGYIDQPLAKYRLNPQGLSKSVFKFERELWKVMEKHLLCSTLNESKKRFGLWLFFRHMCHSYAKISEFKIALSFLWKSIKSKPAKLGNISSMLYIAYLKLFGNRSGA